ncbi:PaaI family thioesterase [Pseudomonas sp. UL073]|uniref:PaaI family thioesterase n=1 Tax=Zestomonas insulae TaxID=2809017 RepID=A0ABS2IFJ7_9GAMM|nr:PaaI family thioesterase [Pseudomonas insulae]MBM7061864.1 PaaI family thioesterase [Pseudomonas insulae]
MSAMDIASPEISAEVPAGFEPLRRPNSGTAGFVQNCQGVYINLATGMVAARILPEHLNPLNIAHGGFLATLADTAFGAYIRINGKLELPPATVELSIDYISPARPGQWIEAHVELHKLGRTLCNASLSLFDGERLVARAKGTFIANTAMHAKTLAERKS